MKKTVFSIFLLLLLFLTACNARSAESDVQQSPQPKAESVAAQVDVSGLPEGQCYNQTPYLNPIGISYPEGPVSYTHLVIVKGEKYPKKWDIAGKVHGDDPYALYHWWLRQILSIRGGPVS